MRNDRIGESFASGATGPSLARFAAKGMWFWCSQSRTIGDTGLAKRSRRTTQLVDVASTIGLGISSIDRFGAALAASTALASLCFA